MGVLMGDVLRVKNIPDPVNIYEISKDTQTVLMSASPRKIDKESPGVIYAV
jgi:hypothetical protein